VGTESGTGDADDRATITDDGSGSDERNENDGRDETDECDETNEHDETGDDDERDGRTPSTAAGWFALIEPAIHVEPAAATTETVLAVARRHAEQVLERTDMTVDLGVVEFDASRELKAKHGYHRANYVKLSLHTLERNGWESLLRTVRHELVHVWQHQHDAFDEGATGFAAAHGDSFERWADLLCVEKRSPQPAADHRWRIYCPRCEQCVERHHRRGKTVNLALSGDLYCVGCGEATLDQLVVEREGEPVTAEDVLTDD
jgi:predicted SprT family Zn-dependent metalloprotease